ncbi:igLON family member 5-like [Centruroides sculpturatus]|uniref:igLON family member 5-like n=1 Tax=Centruroides sculpturatus TaxID=218467 RepID=UPI000C6E97E6|nr:igLON family member 5-like [Centruroides sculpturatus]
MEPGMLLSLLLLCAAGGTAAPETTEEVPSTHTPHVLSASKTVVVRRGEEAVFDCEVDELGGFAKVWKKDGVLYFTNDFDFVRDPRVRLNEDGSLRVLEIRPGDAGEYVCQISTERPLELRHRLVVIVPPSVEPVPGSGRLTVGLGQNFTVGCRAEGSPGPTVTWTRQNENGEKQEAGEGTVLQVSSAKEKDSGEYRCSVSNGYDPAVEASILVDVVYRPVVTAAEKVVYTGRGATALLSCFAYGKPLPSVVWLGPDGTAVRPSDRHQPESSTGIHRLLIRRIRDEDLGEYVCRADNPQGTARVNIELSGLASPAEFRKDSLDPGEDAYTLRWSVKSHGQVLEFLLKFRPINRSDVGPDEWTNVRVPAERGRGLVWSHGYRITGLRPGTVYQAVVLARNEFGWNRPSPPFSFSTTGATAEEVDDDRLTKMEEKETDGVFPVKYEVTMAPESSTDEDGAAGLREFFPSALLICCLLPLLR